MWSSRSCKSCGAWGGRGEAGGRDARRRSPRLLPAHPACPPLRPPTPTPLRLGEEMRAMGAACRAKKVAFIGVKVYAGECPLACG